jgi:small subunit ribosomal protein S13
LIFSTSGWQKGNSQPIPEKNHWYYTVIFKKEPFPLASILTSGIHLRPSLDKKSNARIFSPHDMARIFGIEIPNEKRIEASLPYIYGIGPSTAKKILEQAGIDPDLRTGELSEEQLVRLAKVIQNDQIVIEGDLRREKQAALKRLSSINCNRGIRHRRGLPVRGQRTQTNARTRKGKKRTVGAKK